MAANVIAMYDMAYDYYRQRQFQAALRTVKKVYLLAPKWYQAQLLEAYIHRESGAVLSEIKVLETLLQQDTSKIPVAAEAWSLLGVAYSRIGRSTEARDAFVMAASMEQDKQQQCVEYSNAIFVSNYMDISAEQMKKLYNVYCQIFMEISPYPRRICRHRKLRVGYLSADFRMHPVAYFVAALVEQFDRGCFEVYCYAANEEDRISQRLKKSSTRWKNVKGLSHQQVADLVYKDEIDILVDLSGHTKNTLLPVFFWQAAPVQISGIGYFNSTGIPCTDGFLSDIYCTPEATGRNPFFVEPLLRLPCTHFCYTILQDMPTVGNAPYRENGYITFGCFNNFAKITDDILRAWSKILVQVPGSRLLLKHKIFGTKEGCAFSKNRLASLGIPLERIVLQGYTEEYLMEYHNVDIALDTYPYTGGMTTFEALYMGVPVISLYGNRHGTRFGYSLLTNAGVGELAADSIEEYIAKAVGLAADETLLQLLHENLRRMVTKSPLMDTVRYTQQVETVYKHIWQEKCGG